MEDDQGPIASRDAYESTLIRTGLPYVFTLCTCFVLGFVLTFYGYLMGKNHMWGVSFVTSMAFFLVCFGYTREVYDVGLGSVHGVPSIKIYYLYAAGAALLASLSICFCKKVAVYIAGLVAGLLLAELIWRQVLWKFSCIENTGAVPQFLLVLTTVIGSIALGMLLMMRFVWSEYVGTALASVAGGCVLAWGVNYATLTWNHSSWIDMGFLSFLGGLSQRTYERHSESKNANILFAMWGISSLSGFLWQVGDIRLHRDDGENFIASDYEHIEEHRHTPK